MCETVGGLINRSIFLEFVDRTQGNPSAFNQKNVNIAVQNLQPGPVGPSVSVQNPQPGPVGPFVRVQSIQPGPVEPSVRVQSFQQGRLGLSYTVQAKNGIICK
jgi:hypothetical protein